MLSSRATEIIAPVMIQHPMADEIETAHINGLVGMTSGKFMPDGKLTREQIAVLLDRALIQRCGDSSAEKDPFRM